jgi:hypothetical protein
MAKKFGGFTPPQKELLARKMGFNGPMDKFGEFIQSSPEHQNKFLSYEKKAKQLIEGSAPQTPKPPVAFSSGGLVTSTSTTTPLFDSNSQGARLTQQAITDPTSLMTSVVATPLQTEQNQFIDSSSGQVEANADVQPAQAATTATAQTEPQTAAPTVQTATSSPAVTQATDQMQASTGTVSNSAKVEAATATPSVDATVQGQLVKLMSQFEGDNTPPWAAGAIRNANAIMAQRGLGSSSMAGSAVTQAAMESAISIAAQDAATFSQFEMQNLNNRQQARLQNAQAFLQMDLANLSNEQQMNVFKSQSIIQGLFTDQAAENASRQFNASSQGQTDQFFASLRTQVSQFNAAQANATEQFNAGQTNSVNMFNRQMNDARDQFNAQNRLIIDQSNAEWRRAVTTTNNANINEANRINAQTATGLTTAAYNNLMQRERDLYSFVFTASENAAQRAHELTVANMQARSANRAATGEALGTLAGAVVSGLFSKF